MKANHAALEHDLEIAVKKLVFDEDGERFYLELPHPQETLADRLIAIDKRLEPFRKTTLTVLERANE
ncbi:MAG: hypothetical protein V1857_03945 [archaeon]